MRITETALIALLAGAVILILVTHIPSAPVVVAHIIARLGH